ncbi:hypothetical protein T4E_7945 [Trichinella pseudospiralis]|uniref:Uncharacterized protein n=1 Tax=Trichinella pseudospiralis TaxID=6337 RepID=A0A0V0X905_TRIPS|nr:hypothetical protein T4E_7945 [Trichinella pseudospiralis]
MNMKLQVVLCSVFLVFVLPNFSVAYDVAEGEKFKAYLVTAVDTFKILSQKADVLKERIRSVYKIGDDGDISQCQEITQMATIPDEEVYEGMSENNNDVDRLDEQMHGIYINADAPPNLKRLYQFMINYAHNAKIPASDYQTTCLLGGLPKPTRLNYHTCQCFAAALKSIDKVQGFHNLYFKTISQYLPHL